MLVGDTDIIFKALALIKIGGPWFCLPEKARNRSNVELLVFFLRQFFW
jgi:hypothetical protein